MALQDSTSFNMSLRASFDKNFLTLSQQQEEEEEEERGGLYDLLFASNKMGKFESFARYRQLTKFILHQKQFSGHVFSSSLSKM